MINTLGSSGLDTTYVGEFTHTVMHFLVNWQTEDCASLPDQAVMSFATKEYVENNATIKCFCLFFNEYCFFVFMVTVAKTLAFLCKGLFNNPAHSTSFLPQ